MIIARTVLHQGKRLSVRRFSRDTKETWIDILLQSATNNQRISLEGFTEYQRHVANVIASNTEITRDHMTPELKLFLLTERCPLYHEPFVDADGNRGFDAFTRNIFRDPFWSIYWPGGQVLTRYVLDEKENILRRAMRNVRESRPRVLDLGAGCGATAIAVRSIGPWKVVANDINKVACTAIAMNAMLNGVDIEVSCRNLLERPPEDSHDVIFVGDLLYDKEIANILISWLENAYTRGAQIYLGDPGRHGLTEDFKKRLRLLRRYPLPESVKKENHGYDTATVWEFDPRQ